MENQKFIEVPKEFWGKDNIRWLRVTDERLEGKGVTVDLYQELSEGHIYDWWFETLEIAEEFVEENYGVIQEDWLSADDLLKKGLEIPDDTYEG